MFSVVFVDYDDNGLEFRKTLFKSRLLCECTKFVNSRKKNKSKLLRAMAEQLFIFDNIGDPQFKDKN